MNVDDIDRKNLFYFNPKEMATLDEELLQTKMGDITVKQFIVISRMIKSNVRISKAKRLINLEQQTLTYIKQHPKSTNRQICNALEVGIGTIKYYTNKLLDAGKIIGISINPGSPIKGYLLKEQEAEHIQLKYPDGTDFN